MGSEGGAGAPSGSRLVVIDAANTIYRAFFALPPLRNADGVPTHAVLGFVQMLAKVLREERPDHVVVVQDAPGGSFRDALFAGYKAHRDAQPEDLTAQLPLVRELVDAWRIPLLQVPGVEADDVIATLVRRAPADLQVTIVSTDKDLMQLVSERVALLDTMRDRRFGPREVEERFGVPVERVLDLRALVGDPSDNIPGVKGIGEKGAAQLLREWGDLERLLAHAGEVGSKRAREALQTQADAARLSKRLATLRDDVALPIELADLRLREPDRERLRALYRRLGFTRLLQTLGTGDADAHDSLASAPTEKLEIGPDPVPAVAPPDALPFEVDVRVVATPEGLCQLAGELAQQARIVLALVTSAGDPMRAEWIGLAFALDDARAVYVPIGRPTLVSEPGAPEESVIELLRPLLAGDAAKPWSASGAQRVQVLLGERGLETAPPDFDAEIAAFLLDPAAPRATPALAARFLKRVLPSWEEVAGRGAKATSAADLPQGRAAAFAGAEACAQRALVPVLRDRLARDELSALFDAVELPLSRVLARMQRTGVRIDERVLSELSHAYAAELARIEAEIWQLAGERFQIASPKQLQRILFEKLKLPVLRKTKTGYSTDEDVLEQLSPQHPLPERVLAHRKLAKLKGTYIDALPPLVNPRTGRVHPTFLQTGAATGRLACVDPNVQNIPIRTAEGIRIREAFVPAEACTLVSADYSQVELRILAHFSGDESLIDAFRRGEDIHRRTWAEVAGKKPEEVSADERARAKAVNFGIIYGSSAFGLAHQLGIATGEAQATIEAYFARYRGVRRFLDETIAEARTRGFVRTLLGRRRYLPDLGSRNRVLRQAAERMAVNTVIQGTAADLIKRAMVEVDAALRAEALGSRMILQVHDELVFEVPHAEEARVRVLARERMGAAGALRVPLEVEIGSGANWREAH